MRQTATRVLLLVLAAAAIPACGGGGGGGGGRDTNTTGGSASGPANNLTFGGFGSDADIFAQGAITFGVNSAQTKSATPAAPAAAPEITDLTADVALAGSGQITGTLTGSGAATRTITVAGDLRISGSLFSGQFGGTQINLVINALSGTVYISGKVNGTSQDGVNDGNSGGSITITANQIVLTGRIESKGERNTAGAAGDGGAVLLDTVNGNAGTDIFVHGGTIDTTGGNGTTAGGDGGPITLNSEDDIEVFSSLIAAGGNANGSADTVTGGAGGDISLDAVDSIATKSTIDASGGDAITSGDGATAGDGGDLLVQNNNGTSGMCSLFGTQNLGGGRASASKSGVLSVTGGGGGNLLIGSGAGAGPSLLDLPKAELAMAGGSSTGVGGEGAGSATVNTTAGGIIFNGFADISAGDSTEGGGNSSADLNFVAVAGDIIINGNLTGDGGSGNAVPGSGEQFSFTAATGNIEVRGDLSANGGNATGSGDLSGGDANGGGPNFSFVLSNAASTLTFFSTCKITANGGRATGTGTGGSGGAVAIGGEGNVVISGDATLNGGSADSAGIGGGGGAFVVLSDANLDGTGGDITLNSGGTITANGGSGGTGGTGGLVTFDADGANNNSTVNNGFVTNNGSITLKGASVDGNGGSVLFDGLAAGPVVGPLPGTQTLTASGAGAAGAFTSQ